VVLCVAYVFRGKPNSEYHELKEEALTALLAEGATCLPKPWRRDAQAMVIEKRVDFHCNAL